MLPSVAQRYQGACRAERVCPCCDQGALVDEYHVLFESRLLGPPVRLPRTCSRTAELLLAYVRHPDALAVVRCMLACEAAIMY